MARKPSAREIEALGAAQQLMYDAWEAGSAKKRAALALKALALSPLCADAHVVQAMDAEAGSDEELQHRRNAVAAGEAALGKQGFKDYAGHFWGFLETRPYMRARLGLAEALWERGERADAITHLQAMLELNPGDNQGLRYLLAAHFIEEGRDAELAALLAAYEDDGTAVWTFGAALAAFRRAGDGAESRKLLKEALAFNPHVLDFLTGARRVPKTSPAYVGFGDEDEAVGYVQMCGAGWAMTPGALGWLAVQTMGQPAARKAPTKKKPK